MPDTDSACFSSGALRAEETVMEQRFMTITEFVESKVRTCSTTFYAERYGCSVRVTIYLGTDGVSRVWAHDSGTVFVARGGAGARFHQMLRWLSDGGYTTPSHVDRPLQWRLWDLMLDLVGMRA